MNKRIVWQSSTTHHTERYRFLALGGKMVEEIFNTIQQRIQRSTFDTYQTFKSHFRIFTYCQCCCPL